MEIYARGKRQAGNDLDILIAREDIDTVAEKFDTKAHHRRFHKADFIVDDYAFETNFAGWPIEATSGFPLIVKLAGRD